MSKCKWPINAKEHLFVDFQKKKMQTQTKDLAMSLPVQFWIFQIHVFLSDQIDLKTSPELTRLQ